MSRPPVCVRSPPRPQRNVDLTANKARSPHDLLTKVLDGIVEFPPSHLSRQSDEEIVARPGDRAWHRSLLGVDSLIFRLRRLNAWPVGDCGVRHRYEVARKIPIPSPRELEPPGEQYRRYRTVVGLCCRRAAELYGGQPLARSRAGDHGLVCRWQAAEGARIRVRDRRISSRCCVAGGRTTFVASPDDEIAHRKPNGPGTPSRSHRSPSPAAVDRERISTARHGLLYRALDTIR